MSFFCRLSRKHYWSIPHRNDQNYLVHVCYECGAERPARELHKEASSQELHQPAVAAPSPAANRPSILRKLAAVK